MSRVTSLSDLPQNEHLSFFRRLSAIMTAASVKGTLTMVRRALFVKETLTPYPPIISRAILGFEAAGERTASTRDRLLDIVH
jgi:hypothetical protein